MLHPPGQLVTAFPGLVGRGGHGGDVSGRLLQYFQRRLPPSFAVCRRLAVDCCQGGIRQAGEVQAQRLPALVDVDRTQVCATMTG